MINTFLKAPRVVTALLILCCAFFFAPFGQSHDTPTEHASQEKSSCRVKISWKTETESNAFGYFVYRGTSMNNLACINANNPLRAGGTTTIPAHYRYYDLNLECGKTYYYRVAATDLDGTLNWIIGEQASIEVIAKPLNAEESAEIKQLGAMSRREAVAAEPPAITHSSKPR